MSTAKMLNKLLDQTKADARRIKELEATLANATADKQRTVDATATFWHKRVEDLKAQHEMNVEAVQGKHDLDWKQASQERQALIDKMSTLRVQLEATQADRDGLKLHRDEVLAVNAQLGVQLTEARTKFADVEPRFLLLEQQKADLEKLCDKVRDRMKRKELEEERAVLNRKALAGAAPGRDFRR